jgi:hypothetical protein
MTDDSKRAKVLDLVRKLMAKANDSAVTEAEAMLYAEKANALLAEHNLAISEIETEAVGPEFITDTTMTESAPWVRTLANSTAQLYFCSYYYTYNHASFKDMHRFVGAPHNVEVAKMMFMYLFETVRRLAKQGAERMPTRAEKISYIASFKIACAARLGQRIRERIAALRKGEAKGTDGKNLPALNNLYEETQRLLKAFLEQAVPDMRNKSQRMQARHFQGAMEGRTAGGNIGLDAQLKGPRTGNGYLLPGK